ncbi:Bug family tripartite tricarboxylate transporter substrate binding protein [Halalkalibacterium ligniniphilum]|uniref:Bug family tripartite tricarboxylate transporter substrate binding protein n=1 Tax=Halalkalibacterium ligniniphilum TaxID=1134413 RepID=UPI000348AAF4|nr:tripartite tricarboxylate transporter substrate binding protein [Halalkalibacterium ligniniphilum]
MKTLYCRSLLAISCFMLLLLMAACNSSSANDTAGEGSANDYPTKDIEFVVGYNPGGGYSDYAQALAPFIEKHLPNDVNVLVRHMPGAGSVTAANFVQNAKPDGYVIGIYNVNGLAPTQVSQNVAYDLRTVSWLGRVSADNNIALVSESSPYNSIEDLDTNKKYVVSTKGLQSQDTIAGAVTLSELGIDWEPLNHQGTGEAALSVIRGDADIIWSSYESVYQYVASGDLKPLIFYGDEHHPDFPDVPIPSDIGLSPEINEGFNAQRLIGAPPELPEDIRATLEEAIKNAIEDPEFHEQMERMERTVFYLDAEGSAEIAESALSGFTKFQSIVDELYSQQ